MELAGIDPEQVPVAPGIIKTENTKVPRSEALADPSQPGDNRSQLAEIDVDSLPELNVDEVMEHSETLAARHRT